VSAVEKSKILALVAESGLPRRRGLVRLGLPKSTYYRWLGGKQREGYRTKRAACLHHGIS